MTACSWLSEGLKKAVFSEWKGERVLNERKGERGYRKEEEVGNKEKGILLRSYWRCSGTTSAKENKNIIKRGDGGKTFIRHKRLASKQGEITHASSFINQISFCFLNFSAHYTTINRV
jgi:hypothetical protein